MIPDKSRTITRWILGLIVMIMIAAIPPKSHAALPGDCNANWTVSIAEVQSAINMYRNTVAPTPCVDTTGNGVVSLAEVNSVINAFLGIGVPALTNVPNLAGKSQFNAEALIVAAGFSVGTITEINSDTVPQGAVISQMPLAGSKAPAGSAVNLVISANVFEAVRVRLVKVIDDDPKTSTTTPLTPGEYEDLANRLGAVPGVEVADYTGDTLGTINVKVTGGGVFFWRHIPNDYLTEAASLPVSTTTLWMQNPDWNSSWTFDPTIRSDTTGSFATHFPVASANPDPEYTSDNAVVCPSEGKIAIVDFLWTEAHNDAPGLYLDQFNVDGVMLYNRIITMAEAAGFTVKLFLDDDINLGNLDQLKDYKIVMFVGHGGKPGPKTTARLGQALSLVFTPEIYSSEKTAVGGISYEAAWKQGYITRHVKDEKITWTSLALRDLYQPAPNQLVILNECWGLLPYNVGFEEGTPDQWEWVTKSDRVYNLGDALMDAGVKVVFGYVTPGTPFATVYNTMPFLRRLFGGYYNNDVPPSRFGLSYWPTCMAAQTFFRLPSTPEKANYAAKFTGDVIHTMYAVPEVQYLREVCRTDPPTANKQSNMQQFMLKVGTPATALSDYCWNTYWSKNDYPSYLRDAICYRGDNPTTEAATKDAACAVKEARKVTNAILAQ